MQNIDHILTVPINRGVAVVNMADELNVDSLIHRLLEGKVHFLMLNQQNFQSALNKV